MIEVHPYGERYWYPHMKPNDIAIWERFMSANPEFFDTVSYDVVCGDGPQFDETAGGTLGPDIKKLYQLKIDVVGYKGEDIYIVEIGPEATAAKVGQVKNYLRLFKRDYTPPVEPRPVVLTSAMRPSDIAFAKEEGVDVIIV